LKRSASGRASGRSACPAASRCRARNSARWRVISGSSAKGSPRARVGGDAREEAVEHHGLHLRAREPGRERAADHRAAAARYREADFARAGIREQALLRRPALAHEPVEALRVELAAPRQQTRLDLARQGEVDVVAAEEEVLAHGHALEPELAAARAGGDERQVGRAAPDVDDEDERLRRHARAPVALVRREPGVDGSLRLLQEDHVGQPGRARGSERQLARHLVERRRHGEDHVLLGERRGEARVPRLAQVREGARRRLDRRDLRDPVRGAPGQDRGRAIDGRVAEPRLGRGHQAPGDARTLLAGEEAHAPGTARRPGWIEAARGQLVRASQVEERGQRRPRAQLARRDELRHVEDVERAPGLRVDPGAGGVGRAEVDADDEAGGHRLD